MNIQIYGKIIRKIRKINSKILTNLEVQKIERIGVKCIFEKDLTIIGGENINIGDNFFAGPNCRIEAWKEYNGIHFNPIIKIGNNVKINSKCHIGAINEISIDDDVLIGSGVFITDHAHGTSHLKDLKLPPNNRNLYSKGKVKIGSKCWICENAVILPGVTIGESSIVGAGAIVTKDVPPYSVVGGNPARVLKIIN